jgi:hypothetical protein
MNSEQLEKELENRKKIAALHLALFNLINGDRPYPYPSPKYPTCSGYENQKQELKDLLKAILK